MSVWLIYRLVLGCAVDYNRAAFFFEQWAKVYLLFLMQWDGDSSAVVEW